MRRRLGPRRYVEEPHVYVESKLRLAANGDRLSFLEIFRPPLVRVTVLGGLMGTGAQGGYYAVTTWLPTFLRTERNLHQLLEDQIKRLGLHGHYQVQKAEIIGRNGTSFTFHGLRDQSVHNIKSLEGAFAVYRMMAI